MLILHNLAYAILYCSLLLLCIQLMAFHCNDNKVEFNLYIRKNAIVYYTCTLNIVHLCQNFEGKAIQFLVSVCKVAVEFTEMQGKPP